MVLKLIKRRWEWVFKVYPLVDMLHVIKCLFY